MESIEIIENEEKNILTGKSYLGENQENLSRERMDKKYEFPHWGTYLQWKKLGRKIIKGEKGVRLFHPTKIKFELALSFK